MKSEKKITNHKTIPSSNFYVTVASVKTYVRFFKHPKRHKIQNIVGKNLNADLRVFRASCLIFQFSQQCLECIAPKPQSRQLFEFYPKVLVSYTYPCRFFDALFFNPDQFSFFYEFKRLCRLIPCSFPFLEIQSQYRFGQTFDKSRGRKFQGL